MKFLRLILTPFLFLGMAFLFFSCTRSKELGSKENPIKFLLVPAQDTLTLLDKSKGLEKFLEQETQLEFSVELPINYVAVVEAFGTKRADLAIINTFGYIMANQKYGVQARLKLINRGRDEYYGQIIARVDGPKTIKDLQGKSFAYVDPASTSGYLLPLRLLKQEDIKVKEFMFAGKHDGVVQAVYQKKVDAGATFYTPPDEDGTPKDARWLLRTQYPDIYEKVKILKLTGPIPNDPIAFRKDIPEEMKQKITDALFKYVKTEEGKKVLLDMYHITDFKVASDKDYDLVRSYLKDVGQDVTQFVK
ncbi:MAG: phosphate/phosphite/phosphonate ABC transporter substrate-binding protein [Pseudobdellovibrio sp.]